MTKEKIKSILEKNNFLHTFFLKNCIFTFWQELSLLFCAQARSVFICYIEYTVRGWGKSYMLCVELWECSFWSVWNDDLGICWRGFVVLSHFTVMYNEEEKLHFVMVVVYSNLVLWCYFGEWYFGWMIFNSWFLNEGSLRRLLFKCMEFCWTEIS